MVNKNATRSSKEHGLLLYGNSLQKCSGWTQM